MKNEIILTFDLEEWFHLCLDDHPDTWDEYEDRFEENIDFILSALDAQGCNATFLDLGWIAKKYPKTNKIKNVILEKENDFTNIFFQAKQSPRKLAIAFQAKLKKESKNKQRNQYLIKK